MNETVAERIVREFQALTFQDDKEVAHQLSSLSETPEVHKVPGTHFSMLHEPNVMKVAFKVLSALYSAEEEDEG
ncbi:eryA [Symbiodinium necroappetens]|uniref:EryA protein n=1 Tax=Symbiodinium necroappetens TaxID=1628268 RepID=A0A813BMR1_9DINO|nr:eryA [Symbiodinium necroappetens]